MAKKTADDGRDIFEKALDEKRDYENSPGAKALEERHGKMLGGGVAGALGALALYAGGRKIVRKLSRGRFAKKGEALIPVTMGVAGAGAILGKEAADPKRRKNRKK